MKVYEITLDYRSSFLFYSKENGEWLSVNNEQFPAPTCAQIWNATDNSYSKNNVLQDRIVCPTYLIQTDQYNEWCELNIVDYIKYNLRIWSNMDEIVNIFIPSKHHTELNMMEIGLFSRSIDSFSKQENIELTKYVNSYFNNKSFW